MMREAVGRALMVSLVLGPVAVSAQQEGGPHDQGPAPQEGAAAETEPTPPDEGDENAPSPAPQEEPAGEATPESSNEPGPPVAPAEVVPAAETASDTAEPGGDSAASTPEESPEPGVDPVSPAAESPEAASHLAEPAAAESSPTEGAQPSETPAPEGGDAGGAAANFGGAAFETVVTAERSPQKLIDAPRSISTVGAAQMVEQGAIDLPEAMLETPGVYVQMTNRGAGAPILRGMIGPSNLILIDGVRFNTSTFRTGPNQYLTTIDPSVLGSVEIVRGPSSVLYGNGALGGVMQVRTLELPEAEAPSARGSIWVHSADGALGGVVGLADREGPLAFVVGGTGTEHETLRAGDGDRQPISDFITGSWHSKLRYEIDDRWSVTGAYLGTVIRDAGRADRLGQGDIRFYDNDDHLGYLRLDYAGKGMLSGGHLVASIHHVYEEVERFSCRTADIGGQSVVTDRRGCVERDLATITGRRLNRDGVTVLGGEGALALSLMDGHLDLLAGAEAYFDYVDSSAIDARESTGFVPTRRDRGNFSKDSTYETYGVFVHGRDHLFDWGDAGSVFFTAGGRISSFAAHADDVPGLGNVDYDFTGFVGSVGGQYVWQEKLNVYASLMQGFRAPNLQETTVLGDTGSKFEIPNDELSPEKSTTFEIGARGRAGPLTVAASVFRNKLTDAIDEEAATYEGATEVDGKPVVRRVNAAEALYRGAEAEATLRWWQLALRANATTIRGELADETPARRVPPPFGTLALRFDGGSTPGWLEVAVRWSDRQDRLHPSDERDLRICETAQYSGLLREPCDGTAPWTTLNIRGGWRFDENVRLDVAVHNVTDERYRYHGSGVLAPGLDGRVRLTVQY